MPRREIMKHMLRDNIALITVRQVEQGRFSHCLATSGLMESRITTNNRGISYFFPLYTYRYPDQKKLPRANETFPRQTNINRGFFDLLAGHPGFAGGLTGEQVFYYIYALLFSSRYRETYADGLSGDFPGVPFTADYELFQELSLLGEGLCRVHLLKAPQLRKPVTNFYGVGDNLVKAKEIGFVVPEVPVAPGAPGEPRAESRGLGRVYINGDMYFDSIAVELWEYELCGYRVLRQWLKGRAGVRLRAEDIEYFKRMVRALQLTIEYRDRIDGLYEGIERNLLDWDSR